MAIGFGVMRVFFFFFFVINVSGQAWGAVWYVSQAGAGQGTGTSYADRWAEQNIVWGPGGVVAGDTIKFCGVFSYNQAGPSFAFKVGASGVVGRDIVLDGNCAAEGSLARAVANSSGTRANFLTTGVYSHITIKNFDVGEFTNHGLWLCDTAICDQSVERNITVTGMYIHDISGRPEANPNAIYLGGRRITVTDSNFRNCGDDCVRGQGKNNVLSRLTIANPGLDTSTGDCIGYNGQVDGLLISENRCTHPHDEKQCFLISGPSDLGTVSLTENVCVLPVGGMVSIGIYSEAAGTFLRNVVVGGAKGMHFLNSYGVIYVYSNTSMNVTESCFGVGFGSLNTDVRMQDNFGLNCGRYGIALDTRSIRSVARGNSISGAEEGYWELAPGNTEYHNYFLGVRLPVTYGPDHRAGALGEGSRTSPQ